MPFSGFDSWSDCIDTMTEEEGHDMDSAENICGALQAEEKSEHGNPSELLEALKQGAGMISDVSVDFNSAVDVPAINSKWVAMKSDRDGYNYRVDMRTILKQDDGAEKRISYAPAMIPREPDKEGDVVPTPVVESAAHDYLASDGDVDTDHNLIDGKGTVVESWIEPDQRTWDLPDGGTETYPAGTWMVGIKWGAESWDRIKSGELTGLSIYGMAEHVPLERAAKCCECGKTDSHAGTHKGDDSQSDAMAQDTADDGEDEIPDDGDTSGDDGPTLKDLNDTLESLSDSFETVKEAVETEKQDEQEAAAMLGESYGMDAGDVLDVLTLAQGKELEAVLDAIDSIDAEGDDEMEASSDEEAKEDGDESSDTETAEKRADDANLGKGGDSRTTAAKGVDTEPAGSGQAPSYAAAAEKYDEGEF